MGSQDLFSPEEIKELVQYGNKIPGFDNTFTLFGLHFDGPEVQIDREVGFAENAVERENKKKAAAARERYAKMTPEERAAKNQKRRTQNVPVESVPEAYQSQLYNEAKKKKKKCSEAERIQKILDEAAAVKVKPEEQLEPKKLSRYQRMTVEERKAENKKKTEAKRVRRQKLKQEAMERERLNDPFNNHYYYEQLDRSSSHQHDQNDENQMPEEEDEDGDDLYNDLMANYQ